MDAMKILERVETSVRRAAPFPREEEGTDYEVWKVETDTGLCVLKKAKGCELAVYSAFFPGNTLEPPAF